MALEIDFMQLSLNCKFEGLADVKTLRMWHRKGGDAPDLAHADGRELGEVHARGLRYFHCPVQA